LAGLLEVHAVRAAAERQTQVAADDRLEVGHSGAPPRLGQHVLHVPEVRHERPQVTLDPGVAALGEREEVVIAGRGHGLPESAPRVLGGAHGERPLAQQERPALECGDAALVHGEWPVLLCINHPNNFIDSLVVGAAVRRKVHYLATAGLFENPLVARFLLAAGAIPVWRKQDERTHASTDKNAETFAACTAAFEHGALIAIYPEGTTHAEARVQRLKTGAARIALAWEVAHPRTLAMVPVGLTFEARKSFRARVLVSFGARVPLHAYADAYREDPVKA